MGLIGGDRGLVSSETSAESLVSVSKDEVAMEDPKEHYVLTEDEFCEAVKTAIKQLNRRIIEEESYDRWEEETLVAEFLTSGTRLDRELDSLDSGKAISLLSLDTAKAGGRPSKVDFWANEDISIDEVNYDVPWPDDEHEMAIRSTTTISRLKDRLESDDE